ncbi:MAG TPA: hypothetical protein VFJ16_02510 [Longimicrobium sp.]|nr:hypothetical protein [Longimicrobium sp.]
MRTAEQTEYSHDTELRARLQAFSPDEPGVVFPFSARLALEQGWTRERTHRVIREYLRFVYLAMTAGHPVTPSRMVDEAWHLHLTYTRSYWDELCARVLRRPLHHEPTRGGTDEDAKFAGWYGRTLASYRAAFGQEPPEEIWPRPGACVRGPAEAASTRGQGWRWRAKGAAWLAGMVAVGLVAVAGISPAATAVTAMGLAVPGFGIGIVVVAAIIFGVPALIMAAEQRREDRWAGPARRRRPGKAGSAGTDGGDAGCGFDAGSSGGSDGGGHHGCGGHSGCGHGGCGGHGCGSGCGSGCGGGGE